MSYGDRTPMGHPRTPEMQFGIPFGIQWKGFGRKRHVAGIIKLECFAEWCRPCWDFPSYEQDQYGKVKRDAL